MTDEELIARLRNYGHVGTVLEAADRIEALVKERDQWIEHTKNAVWTDSEELKLANVRAERLEAALQAILHTAHADDHVGWQTALEDARAALAEIEGTKK